MMPETVYVRRLTAEQRAQLCQDYRDGLTTSGLRRKYNVAMGTVLYHLKRNEVPMRPATGAYAVSAERRRGKKAPPALRTKLAEAYRNGASMPFLAEWHGMPYSTVHYHLRRAGVAMRGRGHPVANP